MKKLGLWYLICATSIIVHLHAGFFRAYLRMHVGVLCCLLVMHGRLARAGQVRTVGQMLRLSFLFVLFRLA